MAKMLKTIIQEYNGKEVSPIEVYKDIFHIGEHYIQSKNEPAGDFKSNPVGYYKNNNEDKGHYRIFFEDTFEETLQELQNSDFAILNGLTYFGRRNTQKRASKMYAMIFDLDYVTDENLNNFLFGAFSDLEIYPLPNYITISRSGHGVHLYYLFDEPISLYPNIKTQLKELKYALTRKIWNRYTSECEKPQYQGINQGFRVIGSKSKGKNEVTKAYWLHSTPISIQELNEYVPSESQVDTKKIYEESKYSLQQAKEYFPKWYESRIINKEPKRTWTCKDDLYQWWIREIKSGATYGHRYFTIMCLAIYGIKCGVSEDRVNADALSLKLFLNNINPEEPFTDDDISSALECYDKAYATFPRADISKLSGIDIKKNKRNGRSQAKHCEVMRAIEDVVNPNWREGSGRKPKNDIVKEWRESHPQGKKVECIRDTRLSKKTVYKWWNY